MPTFFSKFPVVQYDMENKRYIYQNSQVVTNILFRVAMIREVLENSASYFQYTITDNDKPETLADKFYDDPEAHWVILYANNIFDPQYDWPLDSKSFYKYMVDKYRPQAEADLGAGIPDYRVYDWTQDTTNPNSVHHYEKIVTRENEAAQIISEKRVEINKEKEWVISYITVPFDVFDELPEQSVEFFNKPNELSTTITQTTTKTSVTYHDYEDNENEKKRNIKVIKKAYYRQIVSEFNDLTGTDTYTRRLI
jgi:hypothetical protein